MSQSLDLLVLGNAIVDLIAHAEEDFLVKQGVTKGAMQLVDEPRAERTVASSTSSGERPWQAPR